MARGRKKSIPTGGTARRIQDQRNRSTQNISLDKLIPYHRESINGNPVFHDYADEKLEQLADSLDRDGQVENIIVFPSEQQPGKYEVLSGKQRTRAARLVRQRHPEKNTLRATVLDLQSVKANTFALGDLTYVLTNVHRRDQLLISELGMAFEMQFQAEKHQGKKTKESKDTLTKLAEQNQTSPSFVKCVRRFIPSVTIPEIIDLVDKGVLPMSTTAQTLTYMNQASQKAVIDAVRLASQKINCPFEAHCKKALCNMVMRGLKSIYDARISEMDDPEANVFIEDHFEDRFIDFEPKVEFKAPTRTTLKQVIPQELWGDRKAASKYLVNAMDELKRYKEKYGEL